MHLKYNVHLYNACLSRTRVAVWKTTHNNVACLISLHFRRLVNGATVKGRITVTQSTSSKEVYFPEKK